MTGPKGMNALPSSSGGNATFTRARPRDHHGAEQALQHPRNDEPAGARGEAAGKREGEAGHADEEHPTSAEQVAEATAGDQPQGEGGGVRGEHPLQGRVTPPRSARIDGPARFATVASTRSMTSATSTTTRTIQ